MNIELISQTTNTDKVTQMHHELNTNTRQNNLCFTWVTTALLAVALTACGKTDEPDKTQAANTPDAATIQTPEASCGTNPFSSNVVRNANFLVEEDMNASFILVDIADNLGDAKLTEFDVKCTAEKIHEISEKIIKYPANMEIVVITNYDEYDAAGALIVKAKAKITPNGVENINLTK